MASDIYEAIFDHIKALLAAKNSKEIREAEQNVNHLASHKGKLYYAIFASCV